MARQKTKKRKGLLKLLQSSLSGLEKCDEIDLSQSYRLEDGKVRLPLKNYPVQINLGPDGTALHLYPERPIDQPARDLPAENYILFNPKHYYKNISGFLRLCVDDRVILGRSPEQQALLNLPANLPGRCLSISNSGAGLEFKRLDEKAGVCIAPLLKEKALTRISRWRMAKLKRIRSIFGGPIQLLDPEAALATIREVNRVMETEIYRARDSAGRPGGVIELPATQIPILVGDLHAKIDNLLVILSQNGLLKALKKGRAALIILGDAVHSEEVGEQEEMLTSMLIMDFIFRLKLRFPKQVFYLKGNHDSFSAEIGKRGVPQGLIWETTLIRERGREYRDEMERYYQSLPFVAFSRRFLAVHAAPPVSQVTSRKLINIREHPKLMEELINNRLRSNHKPAGYYKREVKRFRKCFNLAEDTPLVVGHTPMSDDDTVWLNAGDIDNHHVIYASNADRVCALTRLGGRMLSLVYPVERLVPLINAIEEKAEM